MTKTPKKAAKTARRKVERDAVKAATLVTAAPHLWKPGHDPNDPDAYEGSGWEYLHLLPPDSDTVNKTDKHTLGGGPESGWTCPDCGEMTRIVDEYKAAALLEMVFQFTPEQRKAIDDKTISIILCPKCQRMTQFRTEFIKAIRESWLNKKEKAT